MFDLIVNVTVPEPGDTAPVAEAFAAMRPLCLAEDGCVHWNAYQSVEDPGRFTLVERWASRAHWEAHGEGAAIQEIYLPRVLPRVERDVHPSRTLGTATEGDH
ncbi:antibiotic biosynthesis monooxygenase [Glycomyces sp. TRM65418]|uniref:putative quinol monooxygenase n=1 Tax=Glycomyces sp. TRM65418 TaxID=2867006 RepID=UPI001CE60FF5|nr:antibiotic biosynthesis monooxygenase [Glycomyces sp. TRM65418]MCC3763478.1 antibiotic biosynthesis monooxygenase [Glycomyces sp. TRM65418]QZD57465.1 antibiotic biosynthesis monooxygenase [Glycomyces sp. TRM65418]